MGCDIHLHVEIRHKESSKRGFKEWTPADIMGEFSDRDYDMFERLAGVRGDNRIVPERGIPEDVSEFTKDYYMHPIMDLENGKGFEWFYDSPKRPVTKETANRWAEMNCCCKIEEHRSSEYIADPNYHSFNWCTADELEECINNVKKECGWVNSSWKALLSYMRAYESDYYEVRAVYWFDS